MLVRALALDELLALEEAISTMLLAKYQPQFLEALQRWWRPDERYMGPDVKDEYVAMLRHWLGWAKIVGVLEPGPWTQELPALQQTLEVALARCWDCRFGGPLPERLAGAAPTSPGVEQPQATATALAALARERPT